MGKVVGEIVITNECGEANTVVELTSPKYGQGNMWVQIFVASRYQTAREQEGTRKSVDGARTLDGWVD